jgi:hypothetical protein
MPIQNVTASPRRKELILKILRENLYNSTGQILLKVYESPIIIVKLFWLICIIIFTAICSYQVVMSIAGYLNFDVTTIRRRVVDLPELFPKITLCNKNIFTTDFSFQFLKQVINDHNDFLDDIFNETLMNSKNQNEKYKSVYDLKYTASAISSNNFNISMRLLLGSSLEEFIIGCKFKGQECNISEEFIWKYDSIYGNCFQFNSGIGKNGKEKEIETVNRVGKTNGLILTLSLDHKLSREFLTVNPYIGATIKIDDNSDNNLFGRMDSNKEVTYNDIDLIDILPDIETNICIEKVISKRLSRPYSNCEIDDDNSDFYYHQKFLKNSIQYNQQICLDLCFAEIIIGACNCSDIESISLNHEVKKCFNKSQVECLNKIFFDSNKSLEEKCLKSCPLECDEKWFNTYFSFSKFSSNPTFDLLNENITDSPMISSRIKLNIFYETFSYDVITETPSYSLFLLFSNIGGALSLFLGLSMLSFFEIINSFIEIFF